MAKPAIYLDYAAATPVDPAVLAAMRPYFGDDFYNPSATYDAGRRAKRALDGFRTMVAHWLGAKPPEIIFMAGGTEANNLAIHGVMRQFPEGNLVVSAIEHDSVLAPAGDYDCRQAAIGPDGRLDLDDLSRQIDDDTVLVSLMYANNEIGTVQPIREAAKIIAAKRAERGAKGKPLYLHTDACQAANYLDLHVARLGVDLMTINGGKIYGPKQSGALYVRAGISLRPLISGGGQERGLRSGTESLVAAAGLATALELAQSTRKDEAARLAGLQKDFINAIAKQLPQAVINGSLKYRLPNNIHLTLPGQDNERLLIQLDEAGVMAAAGSACSAANQKPSLVLRALGLSDKTARSSLRFTLGRGTTAGDLQGCLKILANCLP